MCGDVQKPRINRFTGDGMKMYQVDLLEVNHPASRLVCWVDKSVKNGNKIILKECPNILWHVLQVGETELEANWTQNPWTVVLVEDWSQPSGPNE